MITLPRNLEYVRDVKVAREATCWKLTRSDAVVYRFTDHNAKLTFNGETYLPAGGFSPSAQRKSDSLRPTNRECKGVITSVAITSTDLQKGKFRRAKVEEFVIDWMFPWAGAYRYYLYYLTDVAFNGETWEAQISGVSSLLDDPIGRVYTRNCTYELGDARCTKSLASFKATGVAVGVVLTQRLRITATNALFSGKPLDWFKYGLLEWKTGANAGFNSQIGKHEPAVGSTADFTLFQKTPSDISVSDTFDITAGCDLVFATCRDKFANAVHFGGFHFIPGTDAAFQTPE